MFCKSFKILICLLSLEILDTVFGSSNPQVQTSVFKGVPDNWASSIDTDPFIKIGNKFYYIDTEHAMNWYQAAHECRSRNANLLSIENAAEAEALNKYLKSKNYDHWFWTSGNDLAKEGTFYWLGTGEPMSYTVWGEGEPNNQSDKENCVNIFKVDDKYVMNDTYCTGDLYYICEAKTPTTVAITVW